MTADKGNAGSERIWVDHCSVVIQEGCRVARRVDERSDEEVAETNRDSVGRDTKTCRSIEVPVELRCLGCAIFTRVALFQQRVKANKRTERKGSGDWIRRREDITIGERS